MIWGHLHNKVILKPLGENKNNLEKKNIKNIHRIARTQYQELW